MNTMEFGIFEMFSASENEYYADIKSMFEGHLDRGVLADELGYDYYFPIEHQSSPGGQLAASNVFLMALAERTQQLRFGMLLHQWLVTADGMNPITLTVIENCKVATHVNSNYVKIRCDGQPDFLWCRQCFQRQGAVTATHGDFIFQFFAFFSYIGVFYVILVFIIDVEFQAP